MAPMKRGDAGRTSGDGGQRSGIEAAAEPTTPGRGPSLDVEGELYGQLQEIGPGEGWKQGNA